MTNKNNDDTVILFYDTNVDVNANVIDIKAIGERIRYIRKSKNLTQENLAELANVSPHYIYEIEKGLKTMSINVFYSLSVALTTSSDYLLFGESDIYNQITSSLPPDMLSTLTQNLSPEQKEHLAQILAVALPFLK